MEKMFLWAYIKVYILSISCQVDKNERDRQRGDKLLYITQQNDEEQDVGNKISHTYAYANTIWGKTVCLGLSLKSLK